MSTLEAALLEIDPSSTSSSSTSLPLPLGASTFSPPFMGFGTTSAPLPPPSSSAVGGGGGGGAAGDQAFPFAPPAMPVSGLFLPSPATASPVPAAGDGGSGQKMSHADEGEHSLHVLDIIEEALREIEQLGPVPQAPPTAGGAQQPSTAEAGPAQETAGRVGFDREFLLSVVQGLEGVDVTSVPVLDAIEQIETGSLPGPEAVEKRRDESARSFLQSSLSSLVGTLPSVGELSDDDDDIDDFYNDREQPYHPVHPNVTVETSHTTSTSAQPVDDLPPLLDSSDDGSEGERKDEDDDIPPLIDTSDTDDYDSEVPPLYPDDYSDDEDDDDGEHMDDNVSFLRDALLQSFLYSHHGEQPSSFSADFRNRVRFNLPALQSDSDRDEETGSSDEDENEAVISSSSTSTGPNLSSGSTVTNEILATPANSTSAKESEMDSDKAIKVAALENTTDSDQLFAHVDEMLDFNDLRNNSIKKLEEFCEQKGILLKKKGEKRNIDEGSALGEQYKRRLITLIQRYKEEDDEYEFLAEFEAQIPADVMTAEDCKVRANALLTAGQYEAAVRYYTKAINISIRETREKGFESDDDRTKKAFYFANRALAHLKWGNYASSVSDSTRAIQLDPHYPKGYYRRGTALIEMHQHRKALEDFKIVISLKPGDKDAQRQIRKCEQIIRAHGFEAPPRPVYTGTQKQAESCVRWAPSFWSESHQAKLVEMAARVLAQEIGENINMYSESLKTVPAEYMKQIMAHMSWPVFQKFKKIPHFADLMSNTTKYSYLKQEEDYYRTLFVRERNHPALADPNLMLINPHEDMSLFDFEDFEEEERSIPMILPVYKHTSGPAIVSFPEFARNFDIFTEGQLRRLNWNNVFVAGGSVLASIMPTPLGDLRGYFHKYAYRSSDIDLFIYGLTPDEANEKLQEIYDAVKAANPKRLGVVRTLHAITIVSHFPHRHIQIVLRLYKSPAEILMGFDVDCCCIGFDGVNVLIHPRCARALKMQYNLIDVSRRSRSYEYRLYKYSKRGFAVAVPGFDRTKVQPSFYKVHFYSSESILWSPSRQGLARLLLFEHLHQSTRYFHRRSRSRYDLESKRVHDQEFTPKSDYAGIHIPYGPNWDAGSILHHYMWYRLEICSPPRAEIRPVACGETMQEVLAVGISTGEPDGTAIDTDWEEEPITLYTYRHVGKDKMWVTENPGSQDILYGSFKPTISTFEEWVKDAYASYVGEYAPYGF